MDDKYFAEIKAREQTATPGPWKQTETADYSEIYDSNSWGKSLSPLALVGSSSADTDFIANARTDIPALIAEVERLTKENQGLRANSMIQEHIISSGSDPADKDKIVHLIMDKTAKDQQIATLEKALELAENKLTELTPYKSRGGWHDYLVQHAKEDLKG